jgi:hypothetical protein
VRSPQTVSLTSWRCDIYFTCFAEAETIKREAPGGFPGVSLREARTGKEIGEADILLLLSNGDLVPGECKGRAGGLSETELAKLDRVSDRLGAPWDFVATPALEQVVPCGLAQLLPTPSFASVLVLTGEHLLELGPFWAMDSNPFDWQELTEEAILEREAIFLTRLPDLVSSLTRTPSTLDLRRPLAQSDETREVRDQQ